ncbi:MAG: hypothetical protein M3R69_15210 [Acidobacteriota bacterium]|nr:hypothetical protein [Acidobacteriota bacterium]
MSTHPSAPDNLNLSTENRFSSKLSRSFSTFTSGTLLVVAGFLIGVGVLLFDYLLWPDKNFPNHIHKPAFQLFLFAVVAQTVFWSVAVGSMLPALRVLWRYTKGHWPEITAWLLLFAALVFCSRFFAFSCKAYSLQHHGTKLDILTYLGGVVAIMAAGGSILVNIGLREILATSKPAVEREKAAKVEPDNVELVEEEQAGFIRTYLFLRGRFLHFLSLLGIMLGLVVLAQGAKRYFIQHVDHICVPGDPTAFGFGWDKVMVFGLYYTLILILTFLPTFSLLIATGNKLRDDLLPIPSPHSDQWENRCTRRESLEKLLALTMTERLRTVIAVSAPVLGGLISLLQFIKGK